jgi:hypothetical protein
MRPHLPIAVRDMMAFIGEAPDAYDPPADVPLGCDGVVRLHMEICGASGCRATGTSAGRRRDEGASPQRRRCAARNARTRLRDWARASGSGPVVAVPDGVPMPVTVLSPSPGASNPWCAPG